MTIFLGAISAILVFYFRECLKLANEKQEILARLESYLHHWSVKLISGDDNIFKLTSIGYRWAEKYRGCKTTQEILSVDKDMNAKLDEMKIELLKNDTLNKYIDDIRKKKNETLTEGSISYELMSEYRRDIIDGKTYPADSELAKLGANASKMAVSLKLNMVSLIEDVLIFIKILENEPNQVKESEAVWKLYIDWLKLNRDKRLLIQYSEKELSKSLFSSAVENFLKGL